VYLRGWPQGSPGALASQIAEGPQPILDVAAERGMRLLEAREVVVPGRDTVSALAGVAGDLREDSSLHVVSRREVEQREKRWSHVMDPCATDARPCLYPGAASQEDALASMIAGEFGVANELRAESLGRVAALPSTSSSGGPVVAGGCPAPPAARAGG